MFSTWEPPRRSNEGEFKSPKGGGLCCVTPSRFAMKMAEIHGGVLYNHLLSEWNTGLVEFLWILIMVYEIIPGINKFGSLSSPKNKPTNQGFFSSLLVWPTQRWFSRHDLFIPDRWRSRKTFKRVTGHKSPSQKGHGLNHQVCIVCVPRPKRWVFFNDPCEKKGLVQGMGKKKHRDSL